MTRPFRKAWAGACSALLMVCGFASADHQLHAPRMQQPVCAARCAPAPAPKVVIHMQEPEVIYEPAPADCGRHGLFRGKSRRAPLASATNTVTTASVLTPLNFTSGFVGQGFGLSGVGVQAVSPQVFGFGTQAFGGQSTDLSHLQAAQELELMGARLNAFQAMRDAEMKAYNASLQRVQSGLRGISTRAVGDTSKVDSCCEELKEAIGKLQKSIDEVKALCEDIKKGKRD